MPAKFWERTKNIDWILLAAVVLLLSFGLLEIYSVALSRGGDDLLNFYKQAVFVFLGLGVFFFFANFDYHNLRSFGNYLYIFIFVLLLGVLFLGKNIRGTTGWYDLGPVNFQPVEAAKLVLIVYLAKYFSAYPVRMEPWRHIAKTGIATAAITGLVMLQPDFGSAMILLAIWALMLSFSGIRLRYLLSLLAIAFVIAAASWTFILADYQKNRILTLFSPDLSATGEGYNIAQAIIAVGSGGLMGRGVGFGSQSQLKFLPEAHNDFIFAVIAEELGFLGVSLLLVLFGVIIYRLIRAAAKQKNDFAIFFILGAAGLIFIQMFINIGMNIGLLPVVGISLPLVSYGGSAIISILLMLGICQNIIAKTARTQG